MVTNPNILYSPDDNLIKIKIKMKLTLQNLNY